MATIQSVVLRCPHCGTRFPPPVETSTTEALDELMVWGGIVDCLGCHRFVVVGPETLGHVLGDGTWLSVGQEPRWRHCQ